MTTSSTATSLAVLLLATMVVSCVANRDWRFGFNYTDWHTRDRGWSWWSRHHHLNNTTQTPQNFNKIIVGDSEHWRFNFNYVNWTYNHGPFYLNDILVFKYDPPVGKDSHPHSVYQLPDYQSFVNCDLKKGVRLANATQGMDEGFEFVLKKWKPYYFACGESNGYHCKVGLMKFSVMPLIRPWRTHN